MRVGIVSFRPFVLALLLFLTFLCSHARVSAEECDGETQIVAISIVDALGETEKFFFLALCESAEECEGVTVSKPGVEEGQIVNQAITIVTLVGLEKALEAVLLYVEKASIDLRQNTDSRDETIVLPSVFASSVQLITDAYPVQLYDKNPSSPYSVSTKLVPQCSSNTGFWGFALLGIIPIILFTFRNPWTDEMRLLPLMSALHDARSISGGERTPDGTARGLHSASAADMTRHTAEDAPLPSISSVVTPSLLQNTLESNGFNPSKNAAGSSAVHTDVNANMAQSGVGFASPAASPKAPEAVPPQPTVQQDAQAALQAPVQGGDDVVVVADGLEEEREYYVEYRMDEETGKVYKVYIDTISKEEYYYDEEDGNEGDAAEEL